MQVMYWILLVSLIRDITEEGQGDRMEGKTGHMPINGENSRMNLCLGSIRYRGKKEYRGKMKGNILMLVGKK